VGAQARRGPEAGAPRASRAHGAYLGRLCHQAGPPPACASRLACHFAQRCPAPADARRGLALVDLPIDPRVVLEQNERAGAPHGVERALRKCRCPRSEHVFASYGRPRTDLLCGPPAATREPAIPHYRAISEVTVLQEVLRVPTPTPAMSAATLAAPPYRPTDR
jgi:hypothetical protein